MTTEQIVALIEDALDEFANATCSKCEYEIAWRDYVDRNNIEKWLKEREEK